MKREILARPVFSGEKNPEAENVGIMQGFLDILVAEEEPENEEEDVAQLLGRTVDSPEIIMNNLRGDMRSVDARREELADMVGYNAAMETPDEVLALLQNKIAENEKTQGLGALMPSGGMPTPPMMPPQGMPPPPMMPPQGMMPPPQDPMGMPPQNPMPINMKEGGILQNFSGGGTALIPGMFSSKDDPLFKLYQLSQAPITTADLEAERAGLSSLIPRDDTLKNLALAQSFAKFGRTGDLFETIEESTPTFAQIAQQDAAREQKLGELAYSSALARRKGATDLMSKQFSRKITLTKDSPFVQDKPNIKAELEKGTVIQLDPMSNSLDYPGRAGVSLTIGDEASKESAKERAKRQQEFVADFEKEAAGFQGELARLKQSINILEQNPNYVGGFEGILDTVGLEGMGDAFVYAIGDKEAIDLRNNVRQTIIATLRKTLGSQFTEAEGTRILGLTFNRALDAPLVLKELNRFLAISQRIYDLKKKKYTAILKAKGAMSQEENQELAQEFLDDTEFSNIFYNQMNIPEEGKIDPATLRKRKIDEAKRIRNRIREEGAGT